jgi:hypothetical protein
MHRVNDLKLNRFIVFVVLEHAGLVHSWFLITLTHIPRVGVTFVLVLKTNKQPDSIAEPTSIWPVAASKANPFTPIILHG